MINIQYEIMSVCLSVCPCEHAHTRAAADSRCVFYTWRMRAIYIYIYIYIFMCVCVCVRGGQPRVTEGAWAAFSRFVAARGDAPASLGPHLDRDGRWNLDIFYNNLEVLLVLSLNIYI